jgi:integration host factor subunit beta
LICIVGLPRIARNPKSGEGINLPAKVVVHFKPGKDMKVRVNAASEKYDITE